MPAPSRSRRRNNNASLGWLPLAAVATVAAAGLVAWLWNESERDEEEEEEAAEEAQARERLGVGVELSGESDYSHSSFEAAAAGNGDRGLAGLHPVDLSDSGSDIVRGGAVEYGLAAGAAAADAGAGIRALRHRREGQRVGGGGGGGGGGISLEDRDWRDGPTPDRGMQTEDSYDTQSSYLPSSSSPPSRRTDARGRERGLGLGLDAPFPESPTPNPHRAGGVGLAGASLGGLGGLGGSGRPWRDRDRDRDSMSRASEEPASRPPVIVKRKPTVAIVVSSEGVVRSIDGHYSSLLSTISRDIDPSMANVYVLICTPGLKLAASRTSSGHAEREQSHSRSSSFSQIDAPATPEGGEVDARRQLKGKQAAQHTRPAPAPTSAPAQSQSQSQPHPRSVPATTARDNPLAARYANPSPFVADLFAEASRLTIPSQIFPFSTHKGHVHLLVSLRPEIVYVQECLTGAGGSALRAFAGWVGGCVVIPDGSAEEGGEFGKVGHAEGGLEGQDEKYYRSEGGSGRGKRIEIVESAFIGEDWAERVARQVM